MLTLFFMLLCSHFVCDYPLQSEFIAVGKSPLKSPHCGVPWYYIMAGHAFTHGAGVFIVTGSVWLGIASRVNISTSKTPRENTSEPGPMRSALPVACSGAM